MTTESTVLDYATTLVGENPGADRIKLVKYLRKEFPKLTVSESLDRVNQALNAVYGVYCLVSADGLVLDRNILGLAKALTVTAQTTGIRLVLLVRGWPEDLEDAVMRFLGLCPDNPALASTLLRQLMRYQKHARFEDEGYRGQIIDAALRASQR